MNLVLILLLAITGDLFLREPPPTVHPVVWMGKVISFFKGLAPQQGSKVQFFYGLFTALLTLLLFTIPAYFLLAYLEGKTPVVFFIVGAFLLKSSFSFKELCKVAGKVKNLLAAGRLEEARLGLRALVGRNTKGLPEPFLISATVESVAENTSDGFVAPLFYFLIFNVPGAIFYRTVNTLDSMLGYRGEYEYLGKFAAGLDDGLNFIPARITALLIMIAALIRGKRARTSLRVMFRDGPKTQSPNAGRPMAAMAGALGISLEMKGYYRLGEGGLPSSPELIDESLKITKASMLIWVLICLVYGGMCLVLTT